MVAELRERLEQLGDVHRRLQDERADGDRIHEVRQQMEHVERQLVQLARRDSPHRGPSPEGHPDAHRQHDHQAERIEHLHIAAEHLGRAGMHEMARDVMRHAEELERDLRGHDRRHGPEEEIRHMIHQIHQHLENLTREVESIRGDVNRIRQR